jgi:hypothetical protein
MKGTPEEVLKEIPDFDEFMKLTEEITKLMYNKMSLETRIKEGEARVFKETNTNDFYFQNGKPPAVSFVDNTYKHTGLENELLPLRMNYATIVSTLEGKKALMEVYKTFIEIWRTLCSNQRASSL